MLHKHVEQIETGYSFTKTNKIYIYTYNINVIHDSILT